MSARRPKSDRGGAPRRSVVVTGCGQGIGLAIFERLRADGYTMVGLELDPSLASALSRAGLAASGADGRRR